jgi:hypothetical protein
MQRHYFTYGRRTKNRNRVSPHIVQRLGENGGVFSRVFMSHFPGAKHENGRYACEMLLNQADGTRVNESHASAVAQGNVVRAMSASYGKSLYSTLRKSQTP